MVDCSRDYLSKNHRTVRTDTCVVVQQVPVDEVILRAQVRSRGRGDKFQNMKGPHVVLGGVIRTPREMPECLNSRADGTHWYVFVGISTTKPTDEVAHVKVKEEE